ncbi:MFS transporter [Microvirga antarctica]|uniref:MFS transporter n=1 Tax=Microvirga antarctica TaxID=2819233 RepID=UPI001B3029C2|nr:MFS transporter [Microvirga antarctica]
MSQSKPMPWGFVTALSVTQLVSYGTLFYAFALLIDPMEQDLGWSKAALTAAYSLALVSSAVFAVPVGRLIDKGYGRMVMTSGSILAAILLVLWSRVSDYRLFLLIWVGLGACMSAVLYESGFAVLALRLGFQARRGITVLTLIAGFSSTVFVPLTHVLIEAYGWRGALLILAFVNLAICAALHVVSIPRAASLARPQAPLGEATPERHPRRILRLPAFWCFVTMAVLQGIVSTGLPIHLIPLLVERGFSLEEAVAAYTVIGPAQVAARFVTGFGDRAMSLKGIGTVAMILSTLALGLLPLIPAGSWVVFLFAGLYGASSGMLTIVRALLPQEMFGHGDYGTVQGMIAMPVRLAQSAAPFAFGALWGWWGNYTAVAVLCSITALGSLLAFVVNLVVTRDR